MFWFKINLVQLNVWFGLFRLERSLSFELLCGLTTAPKPLEREDLGRLSGKFWSSKLICFLNICITKKHTSVLVVETVKEAIS